VLLEVMKRLHWYHFVLGWVEVLVAGKMPDLENRELGLSEYP